MPKNTLSEECPCCHHDLEEDTEENEERGCSGYGYDYAPGSEICDWCADRESCAHLSKGHN
jgi:hypothetical protein